MVRHSFDAVLFDLDGVILDSEPTSGRILRETARDAGIEVPDEVLEGYKGLPGDVVFGHVVTLQGGSGVDPVVLRAERDRRYHDALAAIPLVPGISLLLAALEETGCPLAVVTSSRREHAEHALARHGLLQRFAVVVGSGDVARPKPHPDPYRTAAGRLGVDASGCVVIEDSENGVRSGRAAGARVLALTGSFTAERLLRAGAEAAFDSHRAILSALR